MPKTPLVPVALMSLIFLAMVAWVPLRAATPESFVEEKKAAGTVAPATPPPAPAAPAGTRPRKKAAPAPVMDTAEVHNRYLEGEFDQAIRALEVQLKSKRTMSHAESVFVFKHLGVMYAASPTTREKGKHYMHELIQIEPTAKILDMYASDMIHLIFRNVQEEFEATHPHVAAQSPRPGEVEAIDPPEPEDDPPASVTPMSPKAPVAAAKAGFKDRKTLYLAAAGAGIAVAALGLYLILSEPETKTKVVTVDE